MKHVAAYMLCVLGGNANPSANDIKKVLEAAEATVDDGAINNIIESLGGKSAEEVEKLIADGKGKMANVGGGGGGGGGGAAPKAAAGASAGGAAAAKKAPEPEPEEEEDMGFSLFD
eukprot:675204-Hanusia_phi.AAC.9